MKISTKGRYAVRLMLDLALNDSGEYKSIKSIAKNQGISDKYLEQIITNLSKVGYVKSTRGSSGGYKLAKKPSEYTIGMILRLTEGSLAPVSCLDDAEECTRHGGCVTIKVWKDIYDAVNNVVDNVTLEDLVNDYHKMNDDNFVI